MVAHVSSSAHGHDNVRVRHYFFCVFALGPESLIRCQADGSWSLPDAYCQVMCPRPVIKGGVVLSSKCDVDDDDDDDDAQFEVGDWCRVACSRGYRMLGTSLKKSVTNVTDN